MIFSQIYVVITSDINDTQLTYDVVTEEACATHSVPECATVVKHVPEQVNIFMVMKNSKNQNFQDED